VERLEQPTNAYGHSPPGVRGALVAAVDVAASEFAEWQIVSHSEPSIVRPPPIFSKSLLLVASKSLLLVAAMPFAFHMLPTCNVPGLSTQIKPYFCFDIWTRNSFGRAGWQQGSR
jgi:hypothetical protein